MYEILEQEMMIKTDNEYVLLDIAQPLMTIFEYENQYYFTYVLQDRVVRAKDKKRAHIKEVLVSKVSLQKVIDFLDEKIDLARLIGNTETYRIGKIANTIYPKKLVSSLDEINDRFPEGDFKLTPLIPNRIDTDEVKLELMRLL